MSTSPFVAVESPESLEPSPRRLWSEILDGEWTIVKVFHTDRLNFMARREPAGELALNERERDIATFTARGHAGKWIGYELDLSPSSVSTYLSQALEKLGLDSATELALLCPLFSDTDPCHGIDVRKYRVGRHDFAVISLRPLDLEAFEELSDAEREVTERVIAGCTNRSIAVERDVSTRTVANQLASVYRKLDVNSRTELAALVATR